MLKIGKKKYLECFQELLFFTVLQNNSFIKPGNFERSMFVGENGVVIFISFLHALSRELPSIFSLLEYEILLQAIKISHLFLKNLCSNNSMSLN